MSRESEISKHLNDFVDRYGLRSTFDSDRNKDTRSSPVFHDWISKGVGATSIRGDISYVNAYNREEELAKRVVDVIYPNNRGPLAYLEPAARGGNRIYQIHRGAGSLVIARSGLPDVKKMQVSADNTEEAPSLAVVKQGMLFAFKASAENPAPLVISTYYDLSESYSLAPHDIHFASDDTEVEVGGRMLPIPEKFAIACDRDEFALQGREILL